MVGRPSVVLLPIALIRRDGETQSRVSESFATIQEYSALMLSGVEFPPVKVWFDGAEYWLSDGFQRLAAAVEIGRSEIPAEVVPGGLLDARWDSYSANSTHGLRRTSADIQMVIRRALAHPNSARLSSGQLARHLGIPETTFRRWRKNVSPPHGEDTIRIAVRRGKPYRIQTVAIGRRKEKAQSHTPRTTRSLKQEVEEMRGEASQSCRRILNILTNWLTGRSTPRTVLDALERVIQEREVVPCRTVVSHKS
jgi:DNA-binding transcriptional regulator YiaG